MRSRADGATTQLSNGKAEWKLNLARARHPATITIRDQSGATCTPTSKTLTAGNQSFAWDGKTQTGWRGPARRLHHQVTARDVPGAP